VLLACALPLVNVWLVPALEAIEEVLPVSIETIGAFPGFRAKSSEDPTIFVFNDQHCGIMFSAILEKSD
jgi:hypothetical protein